MGISEIEILGEGDEGDEGEFDDEPGHGSGSGSGSGAADGYSRGWDRWLRPPNAPVVASLVAVLIVVAAAAFAAVQHDRVPGDDFGLKLISAQYTIRQDASGIELTLALENTGSTMIELTGISVYQPGLIRQTQTGDAAGVTETEAGATTASALGPGTAIASTAMTPKDIEVVTVPFRYNCEITDFPPTSRSLGLAGFSARGTPHTARLTMPPSVNPWPAGNVVRSALCNQPAPQSNVDLVYLGEDGSTQSPQAPLQFRYIADLTVSGIHPVTVTSVSQDNPGIATSVEPHLPITLIGGGTVQLTVTWWVTNCVIATSAHTANGVKITASTQQTVQTWDAKLGNRFDTDLASGILTACSGG